ncbi:hypothetical protein [Cryobacterium sp. PH31-O1]|uniref:DUF6932 family protein n=1 Tax=Cryobacterium sp. PH31-O1 TaxID=3046306 RepID=UPI0024BAE091|nr:hypothetical protein [Cryobacterium sp. PH31-O1]MDJ0337927.1 hypothetical protein [Cryobacterium sp. PH31-O1]
MIPSIDALTGHIPPGRYLATLSEVQESFATRPEFGETIRTEIWSELVLATDALRKVVPVVSIWFSGSFVSAKSIPSDIDCTVWIESDVLVAARESPEKSQQLAAFFKTGWLKSVGLRVDPYLGVWCQVLDPSQASHEDNKYYWSRGHWDDFWQRVRSGPVGAAPVRVDAVPMRGYLEVEFDGYSV